MMKQVTSLEHLQNLTNKVRLSGKGYFTNFFYDPQRIQLWMDIQKLFFFEIFGALFLLRRDATFYNLYFITTNLENFTHILKDFYQAYSDETFVADLIEKERGSAIRTIFDNSGFELYTSLVRMSRLPPGKKKSISETTNVSSAKEEHISQLNSLYEKYFDPICEQIPSLKELSSWVNEGNVIVYQQKGQVQGFIIYEKKGQTGYLRYWFVHPEHRDKKIGSTLMSRFFEDCAEVKRQIFWVIETNKNAIKRYEHFGFVSDKLFDYVYINRSKKYEREDN